MILLLGEFEMSNYVQTLKLGQWLLIIGVLVCVGVMISSQVVGLNGHLLSLGSIFWMGNGTFLNEESSNALRVVRITANSTTRCCFEELENAAQNGNDTESPIDGIHLSSDRHQDGDQNPLATLDSTYNNSSKVFLIDGGLEQTEVVDGLESSASINSMPLLSGQPVVPYVSSESGSGKLKEKGSYGNTVEISFEDTPKKVSKLSKVRESATISEMESLLHKAAGSSHCPRPQWTSARDKELLTAKRLLQNTPILHASSGLEASVYHNVSIFRRSYELMESTLKVHVYGEGEKPLFHQPILGGIYASEGWFIKLMEENKQFIVQNPWEAHLFFLPLSVRSIRIFLDRKFTSWKSRMLVIDNYVDLIAGKYPFWNRTHGADHFLVACHDWGLHMTAGRTKNCIRSVCNANAADGFRIGKDTALPVTFVRKPKEPLRDLGGKLPSKRPTLAFFAGSMHGDLRPLLLKYWQNKEPDMVILGSLPRNGQGQKVYRDYMKNSKYCICARGYEVHTPRIVEAIFQECVPVIIADNYVPPFFEILNWRTFAVFVQEKDVSDLRNILLSIPQRKYRLMQQRVKMVQQHFLWHKNPMRYDLFHMILHSVWYNRLSQVKFR